MKLIILTTETYHHAYFIREISKEFPIEKVFVQKKLLVPPFDTYHSFEDEQKNYERKNIFNNENKYIKDFADVIEINTINDNDSISLLRKINPTIIITFGTGKISENVIDICPYGIINLHGGDPEKYRGLDSHLWGIYHDDFNLIITLHRLNRNLDDGEIILQKPILLTKNMGIFELRSKNTGICIELVLSSLDMYKRHNSFISRPQTMKGRYYSFMPSVLKDICVKKFHKYTGFSNGS